MRRSRRRQRSGSVRQRGFKPVELGFEPVCLISDDQVESIHLASLEVLRTTGMEILSDQALVMLAKAGVEVDFSAKRVRFDPDFVEQGLKTAPSKFTLHARNPRHSVMIGGKWMNYCNATTPAFVSDLDKGRRVGCFKDFQNLIRLGQQLNTLHFFYGYPVEAQDLPVETRHLDCYLAHTTLSDKIWRCYALSSNQVEDAINMVRICRGISEEKLVEDPGLLLNCNTNSPLKLDASMADGLIHMAQMGQPSVISAFTMAGAMAPVTLAGAVVQQNAECLACIALTQLVRAGSPVVYGSFTSGVNMRSGAVALGTPEFTQAALVSGQLARRYNLPYKSSNVNSSNCVDAQSTYESAMSIWGASLGQANIMAHGLGWIESGLCCSFEKMIIDAEMLQMMSAFMKPFDTSEESLAVGAINRVGPGGHFFSDEHTMARYKTAFYEPLLSDWRTFEDWWEHGAKNATERAHGIWKNLLESYKEPDMDDSIREELEEYVIKRRAKYTQ